MLKPENKDLKAGGLRYTDVEMSMYSLNLDQEVQAREGGFSKTVNIAEFM